MKNPVVVIGRLESGEDLALNLGDPWHLAIQGMSRSGKSVTAYGMLGRLAARGDVVVAGVDPTGILLGPWSNHPRPELRAIGGRDTAALAAVVSSICTEMDQRIDTLLSGGQDKASDEVPLMVVVFEEYPSLLAQCVAEDAAEGRRPAERVAPKMGAGFLRLVQEGAKARIRVLVLCQRMDASIIGGAARSNLGTRITMRVDNGDAVRMLHPTATAEEVERITRMQTGVGVIERPGEPLAMFKSDFVEYDAYVEAVRAGARKLRSKHDPDH